MKINLKLRKIKITIVERHQLGEGSTILFCFPLNRYGQLQFGENVKFGLGVSSPTLSALYVNQQTNIQKWARMQMD